jgi:fucose permease
VPLVGGICALGLLPWAWRVLPGDPAPSRRVDGPTSGHRTVPTALVLIGVLVFLYGGVESGFSGWAPTYLEQTLGISPADAALAMSAYWSSYLAGRIVSTLLALRVGPATVLWGSLAVLAAGGVCLVAGLGQRLPTTVALVLLGGATGPIYPSMFGVVTSRFADRAAFAVSTVAAIGCVGAILLPWGMGLTLPLAGGRVLASFPLLLCLGMALALYGARPRAPR